ncbi:DUF4834 family protein [Flavobacterium sp. WW92]|uniref:DUF4834 family protein n=1 Tax=unclassified Flavobacterium TaxID=196869 RepID=UPI002224F8DB|nr:MULTISPECIES: DUF4834 family protein [unclassified Flavobacterium]WDO12628.1 DUF4834 family protein [Flavobacterium sp. WW92]
MQFASFNGVLKTLFILVCIYYGFKLLARIFFPIMVRTVVQKAEQSFQQQQQNYQRQNSQDDFVNGNINTNRRSDRPRETKKVGEYIDYEEID